MNISRKQANIIAFACCVFFVLIGSLWIWRPGIQTDEALFGSAIWNPLPPAFIRIFKHNVITMVMTYVGGLKGLIWKPLFALFGASAATIRIPALLLGAVSIWLFYRLCLHTLGARVALAGTILLATDTTYLLTTRWDWGPVALQHVFLIGGMLSLVRFHQTARVRFVGIAFLLFGLALWDKALFAWSLASLGAAGLAVFPREVLSRIRVKTVAVAAAALLVGAFPLIRYNVRNHWVTFVANTARNQDSYPRKLRLLQETMNATVAATPIVRPAGDGPARPPESTSEKIVAYVTDAFGHPERNVNEWLFVAALLSLPFVWRTPAKRAILFALLWTALTWIQMASVQMGGTSTHHTILLWPMPLLIIAAGLGYVSTRIPKGRLVLGVVIGGAAFWSVIVTGSWYANLLRYGGVPAWTDALYPLSDHLKAVRPEWTCLVEWGFYDNLNVLHKGRLNICNTNDPQTDEGRQYAAAQITNPAILFISHTPAQATEPERSQRYLKFAEELGYVRTDIRQFSDSNGRPVIETFRFARKR